MKRCGVVFAGICMAAAAWCGPVGSEYLLQTKNTSLAFAKEEGTWLLLHYGAKISRIEDARLLASKGFAGDSWLGYRKPATYSVNGADTYFEKTGNKFGGLAVIHADGVLSTELADAGAETAADRDGVTHLVIRMKDTVYPFTVQQHFRAVYESDVVETWVEITHTESGPVRLVRMDSAALVFPLISKRFYVMTLTGEWASEGQLAESPLALGQTISLTSRSGIRSAFGNNAAFMLSLDTPATETAGRVIGGALAWSGAWAIGLRHDQIDMLSIHAGADTGSGAYVLDPGKTIVLPKLMLTFSDQGKGQVSRNFHRWARDIHIHDGHALRPVLLNSWEGAYFTFTEKTLTDMMDGVKEMGGEMFVIDDGWFGRGEFARDDDRRGLGDWVLNEKKLPHGLEWLVNQTKDRSLGFGIWVEPEMANTASELVKAHPDWVLREKTRPLRQGRGGSQVVLDMTNPAVRDNIFGQLDAILQSGKRIDYIKWDANASVMNVGSTFLGKDRQANLWFDYTTGLYELLGRLRAKYPDVMINACSSGGGHMDYGFLHFADEFWTSDNTDARQRVFIQWGAGQFYPACMMGSHVTVVPNHQTGRTTPLKYRFDVAMSGRMGFELHPSKMTADEVAFAKNAVAEYKRIRPVVQQGDLYRLVSPWQNSYASLMYASPAKDHAVIYVYGLNRPIHSDYPPPLLLQGVDSAKRYKVTELTREKGKRPHIPVDGRVLSGDALKNVGLPIRLGTEYDSAIFELTEVK